MSKRKLKFGTLRGLLRNLGTVSYTPDKDANALLPMFYVTPPCWHSKRPGTPR